VWEVIRDVRAAAGRGEARIRRVAADAGLAESQVRLAVDFYGAFPEAIDGRLDAEERGRRPGPPGRHPPGAAHRVRWLIDEMLPPPQWRNSTVGT